MGSTHSTEIWDHVSPGPDHSEIKAAYERDPGALWQVQWKRSDDPEVPWRSDLGATPVWSPAYAYRMRRKSTMVVGFVPTAPHPRTDEVDPMGKDAHEPGAKLDAGKLRVDLVLGGFALALQAVAAVGTYGAGKYTDNGWCEVPDGQRRYADAGMRHYLERKTGQLLDPDTNLHHLAHQAWNVLAELELALRQQERHR